MVREVDTAAAAHRTDVVGTTATPLAAVATEVDIVEAEEVPHTALTRCRVWWYKTWICFRFRLFCLREDWYKGT